MGRGIFVRDNTNDIIRLDAQTLQSAYSNGLLTDCKSVNTSDPFAEINRPRLVDNTCSNKPDNLSWGIREVFFRNTSSSILLSITGVTTSGVANVWFAIVSLVNNTTTISNWVSTENPDVFDGATTSTSGTKGLVPAPSNTDLGKVLTANGTWGYPRRTIPPISCVRNSTTGITTTTYEDGSYETMEYTNDAETEITVKEYNSTGTLLRTYVTTVEENGDYSVVITDPS